MSIKPRAYLTYSAAIVIPLAVAVGWNEVSPILQAIPGYVYLLLVALLARFLGFGPAIVSTLTSAGLLWFYVFPLVFPQQSREFFLLRLSFFVAASVVMASICRQRAQLVDEADERYRSLVELSPDAIGIADEDTKILFANTALAKLVGAPSVADVIGRKTLDFIHPDWREVTKERIAKLASGQPASWLEVKWVRLDGTPIDVETAGVPVRMDGRLLYQGFVRDITERKKTERSVQQLSGRLLRLQDEERRRIAHQLHETTAQNLIALKLSLSVARRSPAMADEQLKESVDASLALAEQSINEIRTLSYLLQPPTTEVGLVPSLQWYARGFEERTEIGVRLETPAGMGRLPEEVETAVFRIVQEALTNIQRHSRSQSATVRLTRSADGVRLVIEDAGRGLPAQLWGEPIGVVAAAGVGVASMVQRVKDLGGTINLDSDGHGTRIDVGLPIREG